MNRIDRVSAILIHLQTKKFVTASEIAKRFEISSRTAYRDIKALEEAGIPIGAEPGKGYFIVDGYHLPPVMFTREEATALLMAEKMVEKFTDHSVSKNYQSAMYKIKSVLPEHEKQYLSDLQPNIEVFHSLNNRKPNNFISDIHFALANQQALTINYQSISNGEQTSNRIVEPVGLCFYSLGWHLIAFCQMRNDYRDFRVDRIVSLTINSQKFKIRQNLSLYQYFNKLRQSSNLYEIILRTDKTVIPYLHTSRYYYGFIDEEEKDNSVFMTFLIGDLNYFSRWLIMFADVVDVVSPAKLNDILSEYINRLKNKF